MTDWIVVGGGMRGIVAAIVLRRAGDGVTLIDASPALGGVLRSQEWDGLYVDKGCHVLDFSHAASGRLFRDILGEEMIPVLVRYASINRGLKSDGIAVPDMSRFPEEEWRAVIDEIKSRPDSGAVNGTLADVLRARFGTRAGDYAATCVRKMTGYEASSLAAEAFETVPMVHRMRLGPDETMEPLKHDPSLDNRLAVSSQRDPWRFYSGESEFGHRNAYPAKKGMSGFCDAATRYLEEIGVTLRLGQPLTEISAEDGRVKVKLGSGEPVSASKVYWAVPSPLFLRTLGEEDPLAAVSRSASILLYTFKVIPEAVADYTYIHDFSPDTLVYRSSAPGAYGGQVDAHGNTYVCAEVPVRTDTKIWSAPENLSDRVWGEMQAMGQVAKEVPYAAMRVDKVPLAFILPGQGWVDAKTDHDAKLDPYRTHIVFGGLGAFGKGAILDSVEADVSAHRD